MSAMNDNLPDDIALLKQRMAEQQAQILALEAKLASRELEVDYLQAQLDKLRLMNFGSRSEKVILRITQIEARLTAMQKDSDARTGRVDDPQLPRQTRTRKPFTESLSRDENRLTPAESCCPRLRRRAVVPGRGCGRAAGADAQRVPRYPHRTGKTHV